MKQLIRRFAIVGLATVTLLSVHGLLGSDRGSRKSGPVAPSAKAEEGGPVPASGLNGKQPASLSIDYPQQGTIFPPEITAPTFLWRDSARTATTWRADVTFSDGSAPLQSKVAGERLRLGEIDPRCIADTNELPALTPEQAASRTWKPDAGVWAAIKKLSVEHPATVTISGCEDSECRQVVSRGQVVIQTSKDPVGAPIFYRDVPLMPSELEKGVIKPLAKKAIPLIAWRLRNIGESRSRLLVEGLATCANCHSFSRDGKTLGMDLDGPQNDKGLYAIAPVAQRMSIRNEDVITWNAFRDEKAGKTRIGFMSQVSPDGQFVVTTVHSVEYVANFKDYRFLQVFYPTRGILAWYSRKTGHMETLPGADDPRYVHANAVWSPDGQYLVFGRAKAKDPYPEGKELAERADDPKETPIKYDLYRIPFNDGKGGRPEPIPGASRNGMSNSFPKVSPDGRWIVFVQCRNGQLMRPDSQLYIVPAEGGEARRLRCNTSLMNSWHSFSPNGRWLVFSSKGRSPYTEMFLTHLDEQGNDSPAILVENATAANRAVNIPEFVNVAEDGLLSLSVPAIEFYRLFDSAWELGEKGQYQAAISEWQQALKVNPTDTKARNNLGVTLARVGRLEEAISQYQKALELQPDCTEARKNLASALSGAGRFEEASTLWQKVAKTEPENSKVHNNFGFALLRQRRLDEAIRQFRKAIAIDPGDTDAHYNLGFALSQKEDWGEAIRQYQKVLEVNPNDAEAHYGLGIALHHKGKADEAMAHWQKALATNPQSAPAHDELAKALYSQGKTAEALEHWQAALRLQPNDLTVLNRTAWVLATSSDAIVRNGAEAVRLAEQCTRLSGGAKPEFLGTLAAAYAEAGRFPEAVQVARRALELANRENKLPLAEELKASLACYESKTPFRESAQSQRWSHPS